MAEKKKQELLRATKQEVFDVLKAAFPAAFGTKIYPDDVETFTEDFNDTSYFLITFEEESP